MSYKIDIDTTYECTQTEDFYSASEKQNLYPNSSENDKSLVEISDLQDENIHCKACNYLEILEKKYKEDLDFLFEKASYLMDVLREYLDFSVGMEKAIEHYKTIKHEDKEYFILLQFLEEFYGRYSIFTNSHTREVHEKDFSNGLSLAYKALDNPKILTQIYNITG